MYFYEKNQADRVLALDLARGEKAEVIPDSAAPKSDFLLCQELLVCPSVRIRGPNYKVT